MTTWQRPKNWGKQGKCKCLYCNNNRAGVTMRLAWFSNFVTHYFAPAELEYLNAVTAAAMFPVGDTVAWLTTT